MIKCKYEGTGIWNGRCTGTKEVDPCQGYDKCKQYKPSYTTNADRIRSMSVEEMADIMSMHTVTGACNDWGIPHEKCGGNCRECIIDWLQQPAE